MAWKGVTVSEQRANFLRDYGLKYFSLTRFQQFQK